MLMQPRPRAETSRLLFPSFRFCITGFLQCGNETACVIPLSRQRYSRRPHRAGIIGANRPGGGHRDGYSAFDAGHVLFFVTLAACWRELVQLLDLPWAQLKTVGGSVLLDACDPLGAGNRGDVTTLRKQPPQSDLCRSRSYLDGNGLDLIDDAQVALEVFAGEAWVGLAPIVVEELLG